ncbi:LysR family transcriptional regulator [Vibrio sp. HI00D65]|uniref:LysR family transcriptional regulator n=1 Tax=Vibrio sp. HI00D65 TaxID=1822216 RepID=UPI0007BA060C|nr:LysR family transcriptional regulator [Vibrio sp. HI00D65]KZX57443.1 LysR family transcriptional regulator [Vibrio sp. HI00D65]
MINPLWLNTFKILVDVGHFTQTAEKLYMTQPGVSQHIKKLEQACDCELLSRENKSFELTEQGRIVYRYALKLEKDQEDLFESLSFDNPYSGQCHLSCSGSLSLRLYPKLLELQQQHPDLSINLEAAPNRKILNDLLQGTTDVGIVRHLPNNRYYQSQVIGKEALCLIVHHRHADLEITPKTLHEIGLIAHPDSAHYLSLYFDLCGDNELANININEIPKSGYINQLHQILLPVSKGLGFTVLPAGAVEHFAERDKLHVVPPKKEVEEMLYLVQKRNRKLPHRYNTVIDLIKQNISN